MKTFGTLKFKESMSWVLNVINIESLSRCCSVVKVLNNTWNQSTKTVFQLNSWGFLLFLCSYIMCLYYVPIFLWRYIQFFSSSRIFQTTKRYAFPWVSLIMDGSYTGGIGFLTVICHSVSGVATLIHTVAKTSLRKARSLCCKENVFMWYIL